MSADLKAEAARRFPNWSDAQRARWVQAKIAAQHCRKRVIVSKHAPSEPLFFHRSTKEAFQ